MNQNFLNSSLVIGHHFFNENNKIGLHTFSESKGCNNFPKFTLCSLIISNYHIPNAYGILPFNGHNRLNFLPPKYISLHFEGECGAIFPKQKSNEIKIICESELSLSNLKYAFFAPQYEV